MRDRSADDADNVDWNLHCGLVVGERKLRSTTEKWAPSATSWVPHTDYRNPAPTVHTLTRAEYMALHNKEKTT